MTAESAAKKDIQKLQKAIVEGLEDVKGQDIVVFNTEELSPLFERVIIASGTSNRQTKALAASVRDAVREAGFDKPRIEGEDNGEWIIVDCGQAVAHVMQPVIRQYYRLEEIWGVKPVRLKAAVKAAKAATGAAKPRTRAAEEAAAPARAPARKAPAKKAAAASPKAAPRSGSRAAPAGKGAAAKPGARPAAKASRSAAPAVKKTAKPRTPLSKVVVNAPATKKKASPKSAAPAARKPAARPATKKKA